jgi:nitroreductase
MRARYLNTATGGVMETNAPTRTKADAAVDHDPHDKLAPVSFDAEALFLAVQSRRSVRTFNGSPPKAEDLTLIRNYLHEPKNMTGPFGHRFRIELLTDVDGDEQVGTYGYIKGFRALLVAISKPERLALFEMAYVLHGLVLHLTHAGVQTIWIGGAFNYEDAIKSTGVTDDEIIAAIIPLGYAGDRKRLIDYAAPLILKPTKRKPMDDVYFFGDFETPLGANAGPLHTALDVARRAPSAKNRQPWRAVVSHDQQRIHLYAAFSLKKEVGTGRKQYACPPEYLDLGIHFRSLEIGLEHSNQRGMIVEEDPGIAFPSTKDIEYIATWIRGE